MALETLRRILRIGGFEVVHLSENQQQPIAQDDFIVIDHESNSITFKIQNGAIKENRLNGCQVDTIIRTSQMIIEGLNSNFPCEENEKVIESLSEALKQLNKRKTNRENRGVEGYEKA